MQYAPGGQTRAASSHIISRRFSPKTAIQGRDEGKWLPAFYATLNQSSAVDRRIFCPSRAVPKTGNTYSIPLFSELSSEPKSPAAGS